MNSIFNDKNNFEQLTESIACDMQTLAFHWQLFNCLQDEINDYEAEFNESRTFWFLTLEAHRDASLFRLCRLYDQHKNTLNLRNWLNALKDNFHYFDTSTSAPSVADLQVDTDLVSDTNSTVKKVVRLRNNLIAHRSTKPIVKPNVATVNCALTEADVYTLIDRARIIVNKYTKLLKHESYSTAIVGSDDYRDVLEAVRHRRNYLKSQ